MVTWERNTKPTLHTQARTLHARASIWGRTGTPRGTHTSLELLAETAFGRFCPQDQGLLKQGTRRIARRARAPNS
eukprot:84147-Alexandrium_andersonii.AAC.1